MGQVLALVLLPIIAVAQVTLAAQYVAPAWCTWSHTATNVPTFSASDSPSSVPSSPEFAVSLSCKVRTLNTYKSTSVNSFNFSLIQPDHTVQLHLVCDDHLTESRVADSSLSHLRSLKSLSIVGCKIHTLTDSSLIGLQLKNLTLRRISNYESSSSFYLPSTASVPRVSTVESETGLSVSRGSLSSQRAHLEYLDLGSNFMSKLPDDLFCPLTNLKVLNLTRNRLSDFKYLGLVDHSTGHLCLQELQELDLSFNQIQFISETGVASLKNLRALYLHHNKINQVAELSLSALSRLTVIDLSHNLLSSLPSRIFRDSGELRQLFLQNNSLTTLPTELFKGLSKLSVLDLSHNEINSDHLTRETLLDLIRLVILDLSNNRLKRINGSIFESQYSLQVLNLNNNDISDILDNSFASLYNLDTLILSANSLKRVDSQAFKGLYVLQKLFLSENEISTIHEQAFVNCCSSLTQLYLDGNLLGAVPKSVSVLKRLKHLNLRDNSISDIRSSPYIGLTHLERLDLSNNKISNFSRGSLVDLTALKELDLSSNLVSLCEHGVFDDAPNLTSIHLQNNLLTDLNGLFMNLASLRTLNVSRNKITWFDYALIPKELTHLDLHVNRIEELGNYFDLASILSLTWLDASANLLQRIVVNSIPNRIQHLNLANNQISLVHQFSFKNKAQLKFVDFRNNSLSQLDINALQLDQMSTSSLPEFYISSNPYSCDCNMEWLQGIHETLNTGRYPRIPDLNLVTCKLPFTHGRRGRELIPLLKANSSNFLCKYKTHCFALCHCCDFDACDCEMSCPENCTCLYDSTWNTNIVDCSSRSYTSVPSRVPMDVTELYIDGNTLTNLSSHTFIGRKNMKYLYLNHSHIVNIANRTFNGLTMLQVIHLEHNEIQALHGFEFEHLSGLRELHLHHNRITSIHNATFANLRSLEILHLEHNLLVKYQVWQLSHLNVNLKAAFLANNPWSCDCRFMQQMQDWVGQVASSFVKDSERIQCRFAGPSREVGPYLWEFSSSNCVNHSSTPLLAVDSTSLPPPGWNLRLPASSSGDWATSSPNGIPGGSLDASSPSTASAAIQNHLPLVITGLVVVILLICLGVCCCFYRKEVKVWIYSKYGVRFFNRSRFAPETEKLFDAFISYCKKDEAFIAQILAPELECGHPPYRMCLRYRDLPVTGYVAEAITEAIESSHRTIILLSEQYLKSDSCRFELKVAHHESHVNNRNHKLIVVLLEKNSLNDLDADARICLRSASFVHWEDKRFWEQLRYRMPAGRGTLKPMNCPDIRASLEFKRAVNSSTTTLPRPSMPLPPLPTNAGSQSGGSVGTLGTYSSGSHAAYAV